MHELRTDSPVKVNWRRPLFALALMSVLALSAAVALVIFFVGALDDPTLEAVTAHPMANPSFSIGEIRYQSARTDTVATVAILSSGAKYTEARTSISAPEDQVPALFEEVRSQAEALGYRFQEGSWSFDLFAPEITAYPGTSLTIEEHRDFVLVVVHGHRAHFE